jgi:Na+/proline symporter
MDVSLGELHGTSLLHRCATAGAVAGAVIGAVAGLLVGLIVHPATAWFAVFELEVPAFIAGTLIGCLVALIVTAGRRVKRTGTPSP